MNDKKNTKLLLPALLLFPPPTEQSFRYTLCLLKWWVQKVRNSLSAASGMSDV